MNASFLSHRGRRASATGPSPDAAKSGGPVGVSTRRGDGVHIQAMKKSFLSILTVSALMSFSSCSGEDDRPTKRQPGASKEISDASHRAGSSHRLRLDNSKKWKANKATDVGMGNMQQLLADFEASATKNYKSLGESLQAEANTIIRKCTMTGEAHDQLHLVLNPMLGAINRLATGDGGSSEVEALKKHLGDYRSHFEL